MKGELKMDVNDYLPLRDVVFNTLRQAILRGEMEPGERLMEIQLAQKLGVAEHRSVKPSVSLNWKDWLS